VGDVPSWVREWAHLLVEERVGAGAPCRLVMYATDPDYKSTYVKSKKPRADGSKTLRTGVTREELSGVKNQVKALDDRLKALESLEGENQALKGENQALKNQVKALKNEVKTLQNQALNGDLRLNKLVIMLINIWTRPLSTRM